MLRAIVAVVLQLLLVLTLSRQAAGQAAAHLDGAQTHGHAHIRAAEGSQLALDFLTLADGLLRERKRRAPHFTATVTYASLMASIRSEAEFFAGVPAPYFFAGDAAYPSGESLIVPVAGAAKDTPEDNFNYFHSAYRCTIERAFGVLVRRWGVLWRALPYSMPMNTAIIRTCVRLHNLCAERHGQQQACDVESHWMDGDQPTMLDVQSEFLDAYPNPETHRTDSSVMRTALIFRVERAGIRRQQ